MKCFMVLAASLAAVVITSAAQAAFIVPDGTTGPFEDWTRTDADSSYAEWDVFSSAAGPNAPDIGSFGPTTANVAEAGGNGAFITGGGNIYSFSGVTDFDVTVPSYNKGAGYNTRFVAQLKTLGSEVDLSSVRLSYDGGSQEALPDYTVEVARTALGGFGGSEVDTLFAWDIPGISPAAFQLEFNASGTSMSLEGLAVDAFTQSGTFAAFPVPEPATLLLAVLSCCGLLVDRRRS